MNDVVIASAARTAIGSCGKSLAAVAPSELGAIATGAAMERAGIEPSDVEHVDAGAEVVLMSADRVRELGAPVRARVLDYASCGVDPEIMGIGPVPALRKVLERSGVSLGDVQVIELNEAFAAQALAVIDELGLDEERVNPNGGAIALGHPIAATGAAITAKLLDEMERRDLELGLGLVILCIDGGQGIALLLGRE